MKSINQKGFTLIEIVIVIVIMGVITTVAIRNMSTTVETAKYEQTKTELNQLAFAIAGNPDIYSDGVRSDFGYVGDVGSLPPNLDVLINNPGGFATWDGPYILNAGGNTFKEDAWNAAYVYAGTNIRSNGSGANIDKLFASNTNDLLLNTIDGFVADAGNTKPGLVYADSIQIRLTYPDGSGAMVTLSTLPNAQGNFSFANIPIGNHSLELIYLPDTDTTRYIISVMPKSNIKLDLIFPSDLF